MSSFAARINILIMLFVSILALVIYAGPRKTGGTYSIESDVLDVAGRPGLSGAAYWLLTGVGQPFGYASMTGGTYAIEGGYVSGMESVFNVTKAVDLVEAPAGYTGGPNDPVPGARVTYLLSFVNYGEASDPDSAVVEDYVPANATYYPGGIIFKTVGQTDANDGDDCYYDFGPPKRVLCDNFDVAAGESGTMSFQVVIE